MAGLMMAAMKELPIGYRFHPTDEELLTHYLKRRNLGLEEDLRIIPQVDIRRWEPAELRRKFAEWSIVQSRDPECWFFCEPKRSTDRGFWKKTGLTRDLKSRHRKQVIGTKKILTYFEGNNANHTKTAWVMHEYCLLSDAFDGLFPANRKNYVLCMIKCNADEQPDSSPSYECGGNEPVADIDEFIEMEIDDDGSIDEHLIQARMRSLLCRTPDHSVNNLPHRFIELQGNFTDSANSSTRFSLGGESIELDSPFSASDESLSFTGLLDEDDEIFEMLRSPEQQLQHAVIMENKQTQKCESLRGFVPIDEKKGIIEDDVPQLTAASVRTETPKVKSIKKEYPGVLSEYKAQNHYAAKIKVDTISAGSSSTSARKPSIPAIRVEGRTDAANSAQKKEINIVAAPNDREKPARQLKSNAATTRLVPPSTRSERMCSSSEGDPTLVHLWNLLVGILLFIAIFCEIFNL